MITYQKTLLNASLCMAIAFMSCSGAKKLNQEIVAQKKAQQVLLARLDSATQVMRNKVADGSIDPYTENYVNQKVATIVAELKANDSLVEDAKQKREIKKASELVNTFSNTTRKNLEDVTIISKLLDQSTLKLFNTAAFFAPGEYKLETSALPAASSAFENLLKDVYKFADGFPGKKLSTTILVAGYADGQGFEKSGQLYEDLKRILKKDDPDKSELNRELSRLRALSIVSAIKESNVKQFSPNMQALTFSYLADGKGEEFPLKKITDYKDNDERRRVVFIYWNVLPM